FRPRSVVNLIQRRWKGGQLRLGSRRRARRPSGSPLHLRPSRPLLRLRRPRPSPCRYVSIPAPELPCARRPAAMTPLRSYLPSSSRLLEVGGAARRP
uniref:Uncharacterized protein n=1 Tax=Aegilops tauschii subsp. strangulata TaxID=200361 RepID=A0A453CBJ5_AEGTS